MAFPPVVHEPFASVRFGRVLFVELAPGPPAGSRCRYCRVLSGDPPPGRTHFSEPGAALRAILSPLEHGAAVDAVVLGGVGDPLRHRAAGSILRNLRTRAHVATVVLSDGILLGDRDTRRDAGEADTVAAWLPPLRVPGTSGRVAALRREELFGRHVEGLAALRRETPARIALEIPVGPQSGGVKENREAWARTAERIRADRVLVLPAPGFEGDDVPAALEEVRRELPHHAGMFLPDGTPPDTRCFCDDVGTDEAD